MAEQVVPCILCCIGGQSDTSHANKMKQILDTLQGKSTNAQIAEKLHLYYAKEVKHVNDELVPASIKTITQHLDGHHNANPVAQQQPQQQQGVHKRLIGMIESEQKMANDSYKKIFNQDGSVNMAQYNLYMKSSRNLRILYNTPLPMDLT